MTSEQLIAGQTRGMGELIEIAGKTTELAPFGRELAALGRERSDIVALTADMGRRSRENRKDRVLHDIFSLCVATRL